MGNLPKRLGWPNIHPVTLELGNGLLIYGKTWQGKDKIALNEGRTCALSEWQFFSTGNLYLLNYQHTLNFVKSLCPSFRHPFDVYYCPHRVQAARRVMTTWPEDFLFSRVAFVIGTGNYSQKGWKVCVALCVVEQKECVPSTLLMVFRGNQTQRGQIRSPVNMWDLTEKISHD